MQDLIRCTGTTGGLEVTVSILKKAYQMGLKITEEVKQSLRHVADKVLGR